MRWMLLAASAALVATFWLPGQAAQPTPAQPTPAQPTPAPLASTPPAAGADKISFEQYRDWRNAFLERRQGQLAADLAAPGLSAERKARLQQVKGYYDWLAGLPAAERDRRYRERFDQIDSNHDGIIEAAERAAWRDRRRAFYRRSFDRATAPPRQAAAVAPEPVAAAPASR